MSKEISDELSIVYSPEKGTIALNAKGLVSAVSKGVFALSENPLESWRISEEVKNLNKILSDLKITWKEVEWNKVNKIGMLEILKAVSKVDPDNQQDLWCKWQNLIEKFFEDKGASDKYLRASKILEKLDTPCVICLDVIFSNIENNYKIKKEVFENAGVNADVELSRLAEMNIISLQRQNGGPAAGQSVIMGFKMIHYLYHDSHDLYLKVELPFQLKEFWDIVSSKY